MTTKTFDTKLARILADPSCRAFVLADAEINDPAQAVRSYHSALGEPGIAPYRSPEDDLQ